jgi:DNA-binding NarL/FixJ family response regulator
MRQVDPAAEELPVPRVLIVDDSPTARFLLRLNLGASGCFQVVGEAIDGRDAVTKAAWLRPDIILLDLAMPVMGGLEAIPHLTHSAPGAMIMVVSGFDADRSAAQAIAAGAHAFIEKKQRPDELLRWIADVWESEGKLVGR